LAKLIEAARLTQREQQVAQEVASQGFVPGAIVRRFFPRKIDNQERPPTYRVLSVDDKTGRVTFDEYNERGVPKNLSFRTLTVVAPPPTK